MRRAELDPVIVVDDAPDSVKRLQSLVLEVPGLEVDGTAATPEGAIELAVSRQPAIMILDLLLEGGSGLEVLEAIRRRGLDIRVIAVTGAPSDALRDACLDLGASFFFDKAFDFHRIEPALRALADQKAATR